jgi:prepilin-type N-terminal cleavage/methylation domain-containing protein
LKANISPENKKGFTLIELLVVIAIIAILAAMLLPVLQSAMTRAKEVVCLSNAKQLAMSDILYIGDYGHGIPDDIALPDDNGTAISGAWICAMTVIYNQFQTNGVLICPICVNKPTVGADVAGDAMTPYCKTDYEGNNAPYFGSYIINGWFCVNVGAGGTLTPAGDGTGTPQYYFINSASVRTPSQTPLFSDGIWVDMWPVETDKCSSDLHTGAEAGAGEEFARTCVARHSCNAGAQNTWGPASGAALGFTPAGINLGCYDGHVEFSHMKNVWNYTWHANWNAATAVPGSE